MNKQDAPIVPETKPNLYRGFPIPVLDLNPKAYESFVYSALEYIGPHHNFRLADGIQEGSDDGFDAFGIRTSGEFEGKGVCIQCKRYTSPIGPPILAAELAKIAFTSTLQKSEIIDHYLVTTDKLTKTLHSALRQQDRKTLIDFAVNLGLTSDHLKKRKEEIEKRGLDPETVITNYVLKLDRLIVWSGINFDNQLGRVWQQLQELLSRFFQVEIVLKEHPRPDFDMENYLQSCMNASSHIFWPLHYTSSSLPTKISFKPSPELNKLRDSNEAIAKRNGELISYLQNVPLGKGVILVGGGGAGKTTTLLETSYRTAKEHLEEGENRIPIFISLANYRGDLRKLINDALGIKHGTWDSLPGNFLLLFDGLDEIHDGSLWSDLFQELKLLFQCCSISPVISIRPTGLRRHVSIDPIFEVIALQEFSFRDIANLSNEAITDSAMRRLFLDQVRERFSWTLLRLPFGLRLALDRFVEKGNLPTTENELIEESIQSRLLRNQNRKGLENRLAELPESTIVELIRAVAFEFRVVRQLVITEEVVGLSAIKSARRLIQEKGIFESEFLTDLDALQLVRHFEILIPTADKHIRLDHDLVADFLASRLLASTWRQHLPGLGMTTIADDAWVFTSPYVPQNEIEPFLTGIAKIDLILASRCAFAIGDEGTKIVEPLVFEEEERPGIHAGHMAACAMGILATQKCKDALYKRLCMDLVDADRSYQAKRELARMGDEKTLSQLLPEADKLASFLGATGGEVALWENVPPALALKLSRARILENPSSDEIVLSLYTIGQYGDSVDALLLKQVLETAGSLTVFQTVISVIKFMDPQIAIPYLEESMSQGTIDLRHKIYFSKALNQLGKSINAKQFLEVVKNQPTDVKSYELRHEAMELIKNNPPWDGMEEQLIDFYADTEISGRLGLWSIATEHQVRTFDSLAFQILDSRVEEEIGWAIRFASRRDWELKKSKSFEEKAIRLLSDSPPSIINSWHGDELIKYLLSKGRKNELSETIHAKLDFFLNSCLDDSERNSERFSHEMALKGFLPIASQFRSILSKDSIEKLLLVKWFSLLHDEYLTAFRCLVAVDDKTLDDKILSLPDHADRIKLIYHRGRPYKTQTGLRILKEALPYVIGASLMGDSLEQAVGLLWSTESPEVLQILVDEVSNFAWDDISFSLFRGTMEAVARRIKKIDAQKIIYHRLATGLDPWALEILQFWHDTGIQNRTR